MTSASSSADGNNASDVNMKPSGAPTGVVTSLLLTKVTSTNTHTHDGNGWISWCDQSSSSSSSQNSFNGSLCLNNAELQALLLNLVLASRC